MQSFKKPKKMELIPLVKPYTTQTEWEKHIQSEFTQYRKYMQRSESRKKGDGFSTFDFIDAMSKRRQKAILNYIPEIYKRYKAPDSNQPSIGKAWTDLNIPFLTHSHMDAQSHILFAASMWILDQVTKQEDWRKVYRLLPTDDRILDELCRHDVWDSEHDYDLIYSIEHVLHHRNPIEIDGAGYPRTITSEWLAKKKTETSVDRQNYEALIAMIPQEAINAAVAKFRALFWQWTDRFYENLAPFIEAVTQCDDELRESRVSYNKLVDEFSMAVDRAEKLRRQKPKAPAVIPLANPLNKLNAFEMQSDPLSILGRGTKSDVERAMDEALAISMRLDRVGTRSDELIDKANELYRNERTYMMHITRQGRIMNDGQTDFGQILVKPMEPMQIDDPYALCFALLYLAEEDDDLPWLYGACCGFMGEVVESLPWGIFEYDELDDDIWDSGQLIAEDAALPKSVQIPDAYERKYRMKGDDFNFPRNLAQIIYEETGCVLPRNLHIYDSRAKMLGRYGIKGKEAASALMLMSTLGTVRHGSDALNLDTDIDAILGEEEKKETPAAPIESVDALKAEIKRLRAALHASDKENRETKKSLASITAAAEREHRELADLREYVFNDERETEAPEGDKIDENCWPYSVQKDTGSVFGPKVWHSNDPYRKVIWRCNEKYGRKGKNGEAGAQRCSTPHLTEEEIKEAFCRALGVLIEDREKLAEDVRLLCANLADTEALESKAAGLTAELTGINTQIAALIQQNASTPQDQEVYDKRYGELTGRYGKVRKKLDTVTREIEGRRAKARSLDEFERELREIDTLSVSFTSSRWNAMVERVDVLADGRMVFRFVCGREIVI